MQSLWSQPSGRRSLVTPVLDKIYFEGLKCNLGTFREHNPEKAEVEMATFPEEWDWPLDAIQTAQKIRPSAIAHSVPDNLQELQDKETQPTRQASH